MVSYKYTPMTIHCAFAPRLYNIIISISENSTAMEKGMKNNSLCQYTMLIAVAAFESASTLPDMYKVDITSIHTCTYIPWKHILA